MVAATDGHAHSKSVWVRPFCYRSSMANPMRVPRPVILRSSCKHFLGFGWVWRKQSYIALKKCK